MLPNFKPKKAPIKQRVNMVKQIMQIALFLCFGGTYNESPHKKESSETESAVETKNKKSKIPSPLLIILKNGKFCAGILHIPRIFLQLLLTKTNRNSKI